MHLKYKIWKTKTKNEKIEYFQLFEVINYEKNKVYFQEKVLSLYKKLYIIL